MAKYLRIIASAQFFIIFNQVADGSLPAGKWGMVLQNAASFADDFHP